jgi:hypothetical protein
MKIQLPSSRPAPAARQGSAIIFILALLSIMLLLVAANTKTVSRVRQEVRLVDQRQTARLAASATNQVTGANSTNQPTP